MPIDSRSRTFFFGIIIIAAGFLYLLKGIGFLPWEISNVVLSWPMLLIIVGIYNLISEQHKTSGVILLAIGAFFMYGKFFDIEVSFWQIMWPAVLIIVGVSILMNHSRRSQFPNDPNGLNDGSYEDDSHDYIDEVSIFSGSEKKITSMNFRGGKITSIFGGSEINLTQAELSSGKNQIELLYVFGGSTIIIPSDWNVNIDVIAIFGGFSDKRYTKQNLIPDPDKLITIKGLVLFGGGEIKSY